MPDNIRLASYLSKGKEKEAMKMPRNSLIWCVLIVCITFLAFTWLTRQTLCELRYHTLETEFAATLAYESGK